MCVWCVLRLRCCAPGDVSVGFDWREDRRRGFFDTMKVQLLLLSALVGLLCAFTSASPTTDPITDLYSVVTTEGEDITVVTPEGNPTPVVTGHPPSEPTAVHAIATKVFTELLTGPMPTTKGIIAVTETEAPNTPTQYHDHTAEETPSSTEQVHTEAQTEGLTETTDPTETESPAGTEGTAERVGPVGTETTGLIIEYDTEEGLSSGQIVGIVVGALLAVAVITAVVIVVVRRMGEYSP